MFVHAESVVGSPAIQDNDLSAVIRIGNDFVGNYYEIRIPLKVTPFGRYTDAQGDIVWPQQNELNLSIQRLINLKLARNNSSQSNLYFSETDADGKTYAIFGNPNLGEVRGMFLGIVNNSGAPVCSEVWFNELRLASLDESGGCNHRCPSSLQTFGLVGTSSRPRSMRRRRSGRHR